jgi:hypothetical protein
MGGKFNVFSIKTSFLGFAVPLATFQSRGDFLFKADFSPALVQHDARIDGAATIFICPGYKMYPESVVCLHLQCFK